MQTNNTQKGPNKQQTHWEKTYTKRQDRDRTETAWFSCLIRHPARKQSLFFQPRSLCRGKNDFNMRLKLSMLTARYHKVPENMRVPDRWTSNGKTRDVGVEWQPVLSRTINCHIQLHSLVVAGELLPFCTGCASGWSCGWICAVFS